MFSSTHSKRPVFLLYAGLVLLAIASFVGVTSLAEGAHLSHRLAVDTAFQVPPAAESTLHLLRALIALLFVSWLLGIVCRWVHQPPVIGEILAGICLGPSLLGRLSPAAQHYVIAPDVLPQLGTLSQIGVILFMFLVGVELDTSVLRRHSHSTAAISHASIILPFVLGSTVALWLYPSLGTATASFSVFSMFLGVSLSVTAFPVLARILTDNGLSKSTMGVVALTCAAIDDVTAWCLLALLVGVAKSNAREALLTCLSSISYIAILLCLVRPRVARWVHAHELSAKSSRVAVTIALLALLCSALITEHIGIHAIFGAFFLGVMIPHDSRLALDLRSKIHDLVVVLLMPAFYALTGMRTELSLLAGWNDWLICGVIIVLACVGKFGGSYLAARAAGIQKRDAASIGILMNTRGLMELVVLNLGLDLGVISPTLFAMMVVMALVTTFLTSPLLRLTYGIFPQASASDAPAFNSSSAAQTQTGA